MGDEAIVSTSVTNTERSRFLRVWGFPLLYLGWSYLWWSPIFGTGTPVWSLPNLGYFLAGGVSPLLAGMTMAAVSGGVEGLRDLWRRGVEVGRIETRWWIVVLGFWPAFNLIMIGAAVLLEVTDRPFEIVWAVVFDPGTLGFVVLLSFGASLVEEIGLRGYYLDVLQERFPPAIAGGINGATWAIWHAPFVWLPGYYAHTTFQPALWWWMPTILLQTLIYVWVYNHTGRSILAMILFHGMMNGTGEFLGLAPEMFPFHLPGYVLVLTAIFLGGGMSAPNR